MRTIANLIQEVSRARNEYLLQIDNLSESQALWKPEPEVWNIVEITEHLYWAEQGGVFGMWKTLDAIRSGKIERTYDFHHKDMSIEQIIEITWKTKEEVPGIAAPRFGGTLPFWKASLQSLQIVLDAFGNELQEDELKVQAQAHPISGALNFHQRFEFLRFHIERHSKQVHELLKSMAS
jgi:hypothetical protein